MKLWLDEQLSPYLAAWIEREFAIECQSVIDLPVDRSDDLVIFLAARDAGATIVSKDSDFPELVRRLGPPPQILLVACGNCSNSAMKGVLSRNLPVALDLIRAGEPVVEFS